MKNRKVLNLRTHIGGLHGKTSYDSERDRADMEVWPVGVLIKSVNGKLTDILVPYSNVVEAQLAPETEEEKRGPGRPPGPKAVA